MTGYTVHSGSNEKFSSGWDRIFQGSQSTRKSESGKSSKKSAASGSTAKTSAKAKPAKKKKGK